MNFTQLFEMLFDIAYLIIIWVLAIKMYSLRVNLKESEKAVAERLMLGFFLLAIGDTGHVGFRAWAYLIGGLEKKLMIGSLEVSLGIGSLMTAYTITILYMLIVEVWRLRYNKKAGLSYYFLQALGIIRLIIMLFPQNEWNALNPPYAWSLLRNLPLTIVGLSIASLIYIDANKNNDRTFKTFSYYIFASYLFYLPVILFCNIVPMLGMLMIPKTVAYLFMAYTAYKRLFKKEQYQ